MSRSPRILSGATTSRSDAYRAVIFCSFDFIYIFIILLFLHFSKTIEIITTATDLSYFSSLLKGQGHSRYT